ncbi:MAG: hypothetical protein CBARDMAM_2840 [uncultured Caballeronia sp.]|nr:MAG: hypothetical protein CBARDMAM_2840 [uncultured Caballeronia sp.]
MRLTHDSHARDGISAGAEAAHHRGFFPMPLVMFNNVLIALDGSAAGERVLRLATARSPRPVTHA